jgi:hypothetical protein
MTEKYFVSGITNLPTYFVLDHNGVILARGSKLNERMKQTIRNAVEAVSTESSR